MTQLEKIIDYIDKYNYDAHLIDYIKGLQSEVCEWERYETKETNLLKFHKRSCDNRTVLIRSETFCGNCGKKIKEF